jgi:hypothetical protein
MEKSPQFLDYERPDEANHKRRTREVLVTIAQFLLILIAVPALFVGMLTYGVAMGDVGEEPNHLMVAVGKGTMFCGAIALFLTWWLPRRFER